MRRTRAEQQRWFLIVFSVFVSVHMICWRAEVGDEFIKCVQQVYNGDKLLPVMYVNVSLQTLDANTD